MIERIRGVNRVRAKGGIYYYHRATQTRIKAAYGTAEFAEEIRRLNAAGRSQKAVGIVPKIRGTLGELIADYRASPEFTGLAPRTRADYQRVFDWLAPIEMMPRLQIDPAAVLKIRDRAFAQKKRKFANNTRDVLRLIFNWGIPRNYMTANPALAIKAIPRPKDQARANRPWTDAECEILLREATGGLKVAIALGMFAALRIGMAYRITWAAYDGRAIAWQHKTDQENWLPVDAALRAILDATPRVATTIVASEHGRPYHAGGVDKAFHTLILRLEAEDKIGKGLTFHGLRHTAGSKLADLGVDPRTIAALLGHKSLAMAIRYSEGADRRRRASAAVTSLEQARNEILQNRAREFAKPNKSGP